jgi:HEPN domain-containing protein
MLGCAIKPLTQPTGYVEARYPNALEGAIPAEFYSDQDARQAIAMTRIVIEAVQVRIGAEPAPK